VKIGWIIQEYRLSVSSFCRSFSPCSQYHSWWRFIHSPYNIIRLLKNYGWFRSLFSCVCFSFYWITTIFLYTFDTYRKMANRVTQRIVKVFFSLPIFTPFTHILWVNHQLMPIRIFVKWCVVRKMTIYRILFKFEKFTPAIKRRRKTIWTDMKWLFSVLLSHFLSLSLEMRILISILLFIPRQRSTWAKEGKVFQVTRLIYDSTDFQCSGVRSGDFRVLDGPRAVQPNDR
jgi:hypothetical protein